MTQQMALAEEEERVASLFQPDTLLPAQYFETLRRKALDPEKRLMLAIIEEAIACYQKYLCAEKRRGRTLFADAEKWIWDEDSNWIFSFENICEVLGLTPAYVRRGLLRWREREPSGGPTVRIVKNRPRCDHRRETKSGKRGAWMKRLSHGRTIAQVH